MINCSDNTYYIYYTDASSGAIAIPIAKSSLIQTGDVIRVRDDTTIEYGKSITLVGKTRLEYGDVFNENMLHLLEHFASPSSTQLTPDQLQTYRELLNNPVIGQLWYNSQYKCMNVCKSAEPVEWTTISDLSSVAGNSGILSDGEYIPLPVSFDGYEFNQSECAWHVSPYFVDTGELVQGIDISADNRLVRCRYQTASGESLGMVNYIILGVKAYAVPTQIVIECPEPSPTPTPSVTPTLGSSPTPTPTVTPSQTVGLTPPATATPTPAASIPATPAVTSTPTVTPSVTATVGVSTTPEVTPTPAVTSTPAVTPTPAVTSTPAVTPTGTPAVTSTPAVTPTPSAFAPITAGGGSQLSVFNSVTWTIPCDVPAQTSGISIGGQINPAGGSGTFTYSWSRTPNPASAFATTFTPSGNTFTVSATNNQTCPFQGIADGTVSVIVTDTNTGLQETFNGDYTLEFTG